MVVLVLSSVEKGAPLRFEEPRAWPAGAGCNAPRGKRILPATRSFFDRVACYRPGHDETPPPRLQGLRQRDRRVGLRARGRRARLRGSRLLGGKPDARAPALLQSA